MQSLTAGLLVVVLRLPLGVPPQRLGPDALEPSPEDYTSLFGWLTFSWVLPLIQRGVNNSLSEKDVWNLSPTMQARPVFHKFTQFKRATLLRSLLVANSSDLIAVLNFASPFFLNLILSILEHPAEGGQRLAYLYAFLAFACQIAKSESDMVHNFFGRRASTRMKTELMVAIYEKALKRCDFTGIIDADAKTEAKATKMRKLPKGAEDRGAIVPPESRSVDTNAVCALPTSISFLYDAPLDIVLAVVFLYRSVFFSCKVIDINTLVSDLFVLGWAAFAGVAFTLFSLPLNWATAKLGVKYEKGIVTARDKRTSAVNELISSIKFIKFGGAEEQWLRKVNDAREDELSWLRKSRFAGVVTHLTWLIQPVLISASSFYVYIKLGNSLTVSTAFTALAIFNMLNMPLAIVPYMIPQILKAIYPFETSSSSPLTYLYEVSDKVSALKFKPVEQDDPVLAIDNGSFKWNELAGDVKTEPSEVEVSEETRFELRDISVTFPEGKITCVVGPTARGVTLSGGQKARVALARAVYAWTKYILLDDPLSAVDSHTARILFDKLFCGPLLKNRTVVLVTHHLNLLLSGQESPGAYYLVRMLDGRIDMQGTVQDLRAHGLLEAIKHDSNLKHDSPVDAINQTDDKTEAKPASSQLIAKLVEDEERAKGDVNWRIYKTYLKASGYTIWAIIMTLILVIEMVYIGQKLWIKVWGEASSSELNLAFSAAFEFSSAENRPMFYVGIYALLGINIVLLHITLTSLHLYAAFRASRRLFRELLKKLVHSTFRWFDTTPKGRILNRVGQDISTIDNTLSGSMYDLMHSITAWIIQVLIIAVVFPSFVLPGLLLSFAYYKISVGYLRSSRDLNRMEANTRSPIFTDFSELLEGIVTIRAFGVEKRFLNGMLDRVDLTTRLGYSFWQTNRWLLLNFDYLGASAVLVTSLFSASAFIPAGLAGLCITSAMTFSRLTFGACRVYTELQVNLNAVERVANYLEIPQEPPAVIESNRPPAYWPSSSTNKDLLVVEDLEVKYAPNLPSVLHRISFALKARERVGILGRTGSGKSTLAMSLLRFVEPTSGRIVVDGIDISTIGLHDLRTRLTFIPQDAVLFSGSRHYEYEDSELEAALYRVHLLNRGAHQSQSTSARASPVAELDTETEAASISGTSSVTEVDPKPLISLDTMVSAEGANFSHGQRQLIAMARALLRQSTIVILDEATSSIDFETDRKIQTAIREELNNSLLVTIAHRINSVIDYDRLIILDQGKIAQFDTPYNLIGTEGIFREMCKKSGAFAELEKAARQALR
ncbi:ATP-dependent bile acid permease [Mycena sanguinolenta]|uniref:ATP-dependent bile acid permease n=1 Tax=Mycena sanguinolenta TaxID=230812 RepID=A0A8H7CYC7_9AGAR|nr:ATP-dependent bile acid permease [Mycena sanguinolenta]